MITTAKRKSEARLTNYIRLMIYGFIDLKMCLTHLTRLSKKEKERLLDSYFVREGKEYSIEINKRELGINKESSTG